jgi:glycosyl hydrolase family 26
LKTRLRILVVLSPIALLAFVGWNAAVESRAGLSVGALAATGPPVVVLSPSGTRRHSFRSIVFGLDSQVGPYDMGAISQTEHRIRKHAGIIEFGQDWSDHFHPYLLDRIRRHGSIPMITWEPWSYRRYGRGPGGAAVDEPAFTLRTIIKGKHDAFIRTWAGDARRWRHLLIIRFAPEMNGDWNSWSESVNHNAPGEYVRAWRHVRDVFTKVGATNVVWVWSPNIVFKSSGVSSATALPHFYPGDRYVDIVGVDGYNWGRLHPWSAWRAYKRIFGETLGAIRAMTKKPLMISETGSTEVGGDKAAWIRDFFANLRGTRDVVAFVWFNHRKETDWRIESSPASLAAFRGGISSRRITGNPSVMARFLSARRLARPTVGG